MDHRRAFGDRTQDRTQRLLSRAAWDTFAAMGVVRRFAVAGLDEAARKTGRRRGLAVGAIDETGQAKAGTRTAGVKRQYPGCVGKVANGISTVHLTYAREGAGHALIGAREWIPAAQIGDPVTSPEDLVFRTKGQLAIDILTGAFTDGVRLDFVCGDQACVLRVPSSFRLALAGRVTLTCKQAAVRLGSRRGREIRSAGTGSKGQRWYARAWLATASPRHHLLIRRHLESGELAFHYCCLPESQPASPSRPIRAAGLRRALAGLAPPPPSPVTLVPQANTTCPRHRDRPGQLTNGCCRTRLAGRMLSSGDKRCLTRHWRQPNADFKPSRMAYSRHSGSCIYLPRIPRRVFILAILHDHGDFRPL